ncbi:phosphate ABC transporter substrate-binding protein [Clostridium sp. 29_15]|uniref:phosphate ABC transporter substrate-binding protein n=1 Tax=Clostridium sp. 29_15 TaxID=1896982 RepID=UPI000963F268|nr:phosphate ABC transporter substrate-binding protein [Clostridium sp. 29_15]OKZ87379.1 MAG: phosphate ABC transporter substrate-binding protein [Clostridium sp. 29_15]
MKIKKIKLLAGAMIIAMIGAVFTGCGNNSTSNDGTVTITVSGSTSVGPLMEKIAEKYEEENSNISIEINQTGSSAGIKDAMDGISQIGMSSRNLKDEEAAKVKATVLAYDGVAVITNTGNSVKELTIGQIRDIFTGKITNWSEVGGSNAPIVVVSREAGSGTRTAFEEGVEYSEEELVKDAIISKGNGDVKTTVSTNENAIGFVSFEYVDDAISSINVNGIEPTAANVKAGSYALSRPFLAVTNEQYITEDSQKLIDYITSEEGQQIVEDNKLITID